jgi:2-amino-4-hydroxy-6-hydroxymethyldihydropteridine diphosphokinase
MARAPVDVVIGLGANLGECRDTLVWALYEIGAFPSTSLERVSSLYATAPVDADGPDFLNAVAVVRTTMTAPALLTALQALELRAGRQRPYFHAPRTLDLDVLLYGSSVLQSKQLTVPHPRMQQRAFVMAPLVELKPGFVACDSLSRLCTEQRIRLVDHDWFAVPG